MNYKAKDIEHVSVNISAFFHASICLVVTIGAFSRTKTTHISITNSKFQLLETQ